MTKTDLDLVIANLVRKPNQGFEPTSKTRFVPGGRSAIKKKKGAPPQIWFSSSKKACTRVAQKFRFWNTSHKMRRIKARSCYNDWYDGYLTDNGEKSSDFSEELLSQVPPITSIYYPTDIER